MFLIQTLRVTGVDIYDKQATCHKSVIFLISKQGSVFRLIYLLQHGSLLTIGAQ